MARGLFNDFGVGFGLGAEEGTDVFGVVVDAGGGADYTTIQDGIDSGNKRVYILDGSYTETVTANQANQTLDFFPGVTLTGTLTVSAACVWIKGDPAISGNVDWTGNSGAIDGENNMNMQAGLDLTGTSARIDGGGFGSLFDGASVASQDGISATGLDNLVTALTADSTSAGGAGNSISLETGSDRTSVSSVQITDSEEVGINTAVPESIITCLYITDSDVSGLRITGTGDRSILSGNNSSNPGTTAGIDTLAGADDSIVSDNISDDNTTAAMVIAGADVIIYGNRADTTLTDNTTDTSTGNVNAGNDVTAF